MNTFLLINKLRENEIEQGWRLLFDGVSTAGWTGFKKEYCPSGWYVIGNTLTTIGGAGDIVTVEEFDNFELYLEWKISVGGDSGVFFRVTYEYDEIWQIAHELQIIDNEGYKDRLTPLTMAGACCGIYAPRDNIDCSAPVGEWNRTRITCDGPYVCYELNDVRILEFEIGSRDWKERVAASKFAGFSKFGLAIKGRIALQDCGFPVWFRNIKIRLI